MENLTKLCGHAIGIRFIGSLLDVIITTFLAIILARILPPAEFGLFGIAFAIAIVAQKLGSCGLMAALVQRKNLTPQHETAAAIFQLGTGVLICVLLFGSAPVMARFFNLSGLLPIIQVQAWLLVVDALALIPEARLTRRLAFSQLTAIQLLSRLIAGGLTIFLAVGGSGAMALTVGNIVGAGVQTILLWTCAPGFISLRFQFRYLRDLLGYGSGILLINTLNQLAQRADVFILGRQLGTEAVGLYQRAYQLVLLPLGQMTGPVNKVLFPAMASIQNEQKRLQKGYLASVRLSALVAFPLLTVIWSTADIIIPLLYGPRWQGSVAIVQILALSGMFRILVNINGLVAQARAKLNSEAWRQGLWLILVAVFALVGSRAGALGVATGVTLATLIFLITMTRLVLSLLDLRFSVWWQAIQSGVLVSAITGFGILLVKQSLAGYLPAPVVLAFIICVGFLIYVLFFRTCLSRVDNDFLDLICETLPDRLAQNLRLLLGIRSTVPEATKLSS